MKKKYYVYQYYDPIRKEPIYIGAGHEDRINFHLSRKDKHPLTHRIKWIRKQGLEPIVTKLHENLDYYDAFKIEPFIIKEIGRKNLKQGPLLNLTDGGEGVPGWRHSEETKKKLKNAWTKRTSITEETKKKISLAMIGKKNHFFGKKHTEETKSKISKSKIGIPVHSKEHIKFLKKWATGRKHLKKTKKQLSVFMTSVRKNKKWASFGMKGKKMSLETREKMKQSQLKRWAKIRKAK